MGRTRRAHGNNQCGLCVLDVCFVFCVLCFRIDRRERGTEEEKDTQGRKQRTGFCAFSFLLFLGCRAAARPITKHQPTTTHARTHTLTRFVSI